LGAFSCFFPFFIDHRNTLALSNRFLLVALYYVPARK
jgi:hypothetical protein